MSCGTLETIARIGAARVLPIATLDTADQAAPLARALLAGGLTVVEITFRSEAAADSIRIIPRTISGHAGGRRDGSQC